MGWLRGTLAALLTLARRRPSPVALPASASVLVEDGVDEATRRGIVGAWGRFSPGTANRAIGTFGFAEPAELTIELYEVLVARTMHVEVARRVVSPELRAMIEERAAEVGSRVALLAATLSRAVAGQGAAAVRACRFTLQVANARRRELCADAEEGGWERWGIAGRCVEEQASARAVATIERLVLGGERSLSGRKRAYSLFGFGAPGPSLATSPSASWRRISS